MAVLGGNYEIAVSGPCISAAVEEVHCERLEGQVICFVGTTKANAEEVVVAKPSVYMCIRSANASMM